MRHRERYTMLCPRCGNEWDASRSSCSNCGFKVRAANPTASSASFTGQTQRGSVSQGLTFAPGQQSGNGSMTRQQHGTTPDGGPTVSAPNWPTSKQNSGSFPTVKKQTEGLSASQFPNTPRPMFPPSSTLIPQRGTNGPAPANDVTMRPAFE